MTDLLVTMSDSGSFTLDPHAGRIEEYCATRLKIRLNTDFVTSSIKYYTLSFEPFTLSRKIVTENIYKDSENTEGIYYADGYIFCPIYDYIAVSPTVSVQIDGYEADDDGNVTAIIKSGIFNIEFAPSLMGEGVMAETVRADVKFYENVSAAVDKALETKTINGSQLEDFSVTERQIAIDAVTSAHLQSSSVSTAKLNDGAVTTPKIANAGVTNEKLASSVVTTDKIAENAVTADKIAEKTITAAKLSDSSVTNVKLANYSISDKKLRPKCVTTTALADAVVTPAKLDREYITQHQSLEGYATETWVKEQNYLSSEDSLEGYATEEWVESKGYISSDEGFLKEEDLPTKLSDFENDMAVLFYPQQLTEDEKAAARENIGAVPKEEGKALSQNDFTDEDKARLDLALTEHQDISMKADISSLSTVAFSGSYDDLTDLPVVNEFTDKLEENYNEAYEHSVSQHAPVNAQENIIEKITVNGEDAEVKDKIALLCVISFDKKETVFAEVL